MTTPTSSKTAAPIEISGNAKAASPQTDDVIGPGGSPGGNVEEIVPLTGAIGTYYASLGGDAWGRQSTSLRPLGDGGSVVYFGPPRQAYVKAIVTHPATGPHWMPKAIFDGWVNRQDRSTIGFPTGDPASTHDGQGRFQSFQRGMAVWHPQTGTRFVLGAILARYLALGGTRFGYPTTDESDAKPGGRFNHFLDVATGAQKSIYWSAGSGAWEVIGLIRNAWSAAGWQSGPVGFPTSGELPTHDGDGRYQTFSGGIYVWHQETGAHAVYGAILDRYGQLGGSGWAYPTTDEGPATGGRYQHFKRVAASKSRSIYWSAATGAVEVTGKMRDHYEALGWERSHLGFPVSARTDWNDEGPGGTQQRFQGGRILYRRPKRHDDVTLAADPVVFRRTINATGVRGEVIVSIPYNGPAHHGGFVKADKQDSYQYLVSTLVKTSGNLAVAFSETGKVFGDLHPGDERDNFNSHSAFPVPVSAFWEFQRGTLVVDKNYRSLTAAFFGDALEFALKWIVGSLVIPTPDVALVLVGGTAAVTAATGGSFASGMRIASGTLFLAGPWGSAFALAAEGAAQIASDERDLRPEEYEFAKLVFGSSLPPRSAIKVCDAIGGGNRPFSYPRFDGAMVLSMGKQWKNDLRTWGVADGAKVYGQTLIHELTHVWQYHNNAAAISYVGDAIGARLSEDYEPGVEHREPWDWFGLEEQGTIVERWFLAHYRGPGYVDPVSGAAGKATADTAYGLMTAAAQKDQSFRYIRDNIRTGRN